MSNCPFCGKEECFHVFMSEDAHLSPSMFVVAYEFADIQASDLKDLEKGQGKPEVIDRILDWYRGTFGAICDIYCDLFDTYKPWENETFWQELFEIYGSKDGISGELTGLVVAIVRSLNLPETDIKEIYSSNLETFDSCDGCPEEAEGCDNDKLEKIDGRCYNIEINKVIYVKDKVSVDREVARILRFLLSLDIEMSYLELLRVISKSKKRSNLIESKDSAIKDMILFIKMQDQTDPSHFDHILKLREIAPNHFARLLSVGEYIFSEKHNNDISEIQQKLAIMRQLLEGLEHNYLFSHLSECDIGSMPMHERLKRLEDDGIIDAYIKASLFYYWKLLSEYGAHFIDDDEADTFMMHKLLKSSFYFIVNDLIRFIHRNNLFESQQD